jgi:hypothetical protein
MTAKVHLDVGKIASYLDRQLIVLLLQHFKDVEVYPKKELLQNYYEIVKGTTRYDLAQEISNELKSVGVKVQDLAGMLSARSISKFACVRVRSCAWSPFKSN